MSTMKIPAAPGTSLAPPPDFGDHDQHGHVAQFYADDAFLIESLSRFIGPALAAGDAAIVIATPAHRESLGRTLRSRGLDSSSAARAGRYACLDATDTLAKITLNDWPDQTLFVEVVGDLLRSTKAKSSGENKRIAVFGEMVSILWSAGKFGAALRLEELWTDLARTDIFSLRCAYPIQGFNRQEHSEMFLKICAEHTGVIPHESYTELAGEENRLRNITQLQQRAQALENEIIERQRAEQALRAAHDSLEKRVVERTLELQHKNIEIHKQTQMLEAANRGLRELSSRLLRVQDNERRRIARELHDSTGQDLALLSMNLSALQDEAKGINAEFGKALSENVEIVNQVSEELRTISYLLHPPLLDEMGLLSALRWFAEGFQQRSGIKVSLELDNDFGRVSRDLETAIFRVVQESLTNIHRHADSSTTMIRLAQSSDTVSLQIEDQGRGIAPEKLSAIMSEGVAGVGLRGMRERIENFGGRFDIGSGKKGTCICVSVPVTRRDDDSLVSNGNSTLTDFANQHATRNRDAV